MDLFRVGIESSEFKEQYPEMRRVRNVDVYGESNEPNRVFAFARSGNHFLMESLIYNFENIGHFRKCHHPLDYLKKKQPYLDLKKYKIVIQIIRNPIDVAISFYKTPWHNYESFTDFIYEYFVERYKHYYYSWKSADIYRIKYEDLNLNYHIEMEKLEKYFDLNRRWSDIRRIPRLVGYYPGLTINKEKFIFKNDRMYMKEKLEPILEELNY